MTKQFSALGLSSTLTNTLVSLGITEPTEIQTQAIPVILNQTDDFVGLANTGTGKTAAFGLPLLQLVDTSSKFIQVVVLAPTRELGKQIHSNLMEFSADISELSIAEICGGTPVKPQIELLENTTHVVVATPGRLIDLIQRGKIDVSQVKYFVLDEADEMVLSLKEGLDKIVDVMPKQKRTLLFSATLPGSVKQLVQNYLSKHVTQIGTETTNTAHKDVAHHYVVVEPIEKLNVLLHFLASKEGEQGIIFCKTKAAVNKLAKNLAINKISSGAIHGSLTQGIRDRIMEQFREGYINTLVATDVAARGIDIKNVSYVVHYHLPDAMETYIHRSGRTARAGAKGMSLAVLQADEIEKIKFLGEEYEIDLHTYAKPTAVSIEENNTILWAKKIFKTKPNRGVSQDVKAAVKDVFHHLTKEELVDKILANYLLENNKTDLLTTNKPIKKKKQQ
ncbi:ATP-dependent RNA helicase DeaD [Wenyingzhuangia heitensis]|uniref:ATP-dependent RNA helicase DeaD n=1 Tax=Wenyingzhuangia heitensis TaxID=1487859 RepID=A0ABX0UA21_9FLAO|nr:DEAD/DEAH box helicase [Wenyingzhuangia heitensis]NIJ45219.1 ATP-dependent RNA helicase DeaD [Wenyingzhuangia heitensis]